MTYHNRLSETAKLNRTTLQSVRRTMRATVIAASVFLASGVVLADALPRYGNGQLKAHYTKVEGKFHGPYTGYHSNGTISFKGNYVKGNLQGRAIQYYNNGGRQYEGIFNGGQLEGKWTQYSAGGQVIATGSASGSGYGRNSISGPVKTGPWTWYHGNGKKSYEASYVKNNVQGPAVQYYDNGQKQYEATFNDGWMHGRWTQYYKNGQMQARGETSGNHYGRNSINGPVKTGPWTWYHGNGKKSYEASYVKNNVQGPAVQYYDNGNKQYEATFNDGWMHGQWTQYYKNGQMQARGETSGNHYGRNSINGPVKTGPWTWYHGNGKKSYEASYVKNNVQGPAVQYYDNGEKQYEATFNDGWMHGRWTQYYKNGQMQARGETSGNHYGRNSINGPVKTGPWTWYHGNGKKSYEASYVKDNIQGPAVQYFENGNKQYEATFNDGWMHGQWTVYFANGQVRATGEADGNNYGRNSISGATKTGRWTWYGTSGLKEYEAEYRKNNANGAAVVWHPNGAVKARATFRDGWLVGPWISYWDNGQVRSKGRANGNVYGRNDIKHPRKVGQWVYLKKDGSLHHANNYVNNESVGSVAASRDEDTGETTIATRNPDGSRTVTTVDAEGNVREVRDPMAVDTETVVGTTTDPETGEMTIVRKVPDGTTVTTKGKKTVDAEGNQMIVETGDDGRERKTTIAADGKVTVERENEDGTFSEVVRHPDGTIVKTEEAFDGTSTEVKQLPNGDTITVRRDLIGNVLESSRQTPDGTVSRMDQRGNQSRTLTDAEGNTTVEARDRWGNTTTTVTDAEGKVTSQTENRVMTPEPGREYFETVLGGKDWSELPESYKRRYANSERQLREHEAGKQRQKDTEAKRAEEERGRLLADKARNAENQKKREEALKAQQDETDRAAAARATREKRAAREREIQASYDKAKDLQKQYDEAIARGDKKEAARIMKLQDEHHEASMEILAYTPDEEAEMNRRQEIRTRLSNKIGKAAHSMAAYEIAEAVGLQDDKEAVTGKAKWISVGAQMQEQTKKTTRQADRERAYARAKQVEIERLLNDKKTTADEREILLQMQEMAQVQEEGASRMLSDNAKITAAGYVIDGALVLTGGKLVNAARKGVTAGASRVFASETAAKVTAVTTERGVIELAGAGATRATTAATSRVAGERAATVVENVLTKDVSGAASNAAGAASRRVVGDRVVDGTKTAAAKVVEVARTDVREIPGKVSNAVRGSADEAAGAAGGGLTSRVSESATPANPNAATRPSTAKKPSEMTAAERQAYNDARANEAVRRAVEEGRPVPGFDDVPVSGTGSRTEFVKPTSKMTRAERQAYNDRMAARAVRENRGTPLPKIGDDILPSPAEPAVGARSGNLTADELERLYQPGRNLTPDELIAKADIARAREAARRAAQEAADNGRPVAEIKAKAAEYEAIRNRINAAREAAARNARNSSAPVNPNGATVIDRAPAAGPNGTAVLRPAKTEVIRPNGTRPPVDTKAPTVIDRASVAGPNGTAVLRPAKTEVIRPNGTRPPVDTKAPTVIDRAPAAGPHGTAVVRPAKTEVIKPHETAVLKPGEITRVKPNETAVLRPAKTDIVKPHETAVLKPHELPTAAPKHGNPTMELETLRDFAKSPRVRTKADPVRTERMSDYPISGKRNATATEARGEWLRLPSSQRNKLDTELRNAIDEAAAMGDKWAKRLQRDLNNGKFNFSYEPGLEHAGLAWKDGMALINPLNGKAVRSGDELASTVLHEYVHLYKGRVKFAANQPGFEGAKNIGQGNEVRAFLAEAIFNRNLVKARMLNGKPFDPAAAKELSSMMKVSELMAQHVPAGAPNANGIRALRNMQKELVDNYYGHMYKDNPLRAAERLSTFRGGSRENINKYIREQLQKGDRTPDQILADVLTKIRNEGGRFSI